MKSVHKCNHMSMCEKLSIHEVCGDYLVRRRKLEEFQNKIKLRFKDIGLLDTALTHSTFKVESNKVIEDNERLEFLGDAVLGLAISTYLYRRFKGYSEGNLSIARSKLVNEDILSSKAKKFNIGKYLLLGKGEELTGGRRKDSILASSFEAVIGAIYLESGFKRAYEFIHNHFRKDIERLTLESALKDYKSELQEIVQKRFKVKPFYKLIRTGGPAHHRIFEVEVMIGGKPFGYGRGWTKKRAEQEAAEDTLGKLAFKIRRGEGWTIS